MADLSLRAYIEYVEDRLARDALAEVIAQARHILETYPKHIDTYRLLAKAIAAQQNFTDALDLFQRVLSADPNDFVSHIGMSDCYREDGALDQAIWHLERAFEQAPSNTDIQAEIKKLYQQRDGHAPLKIQMTSGALARMYVKGKLYDQAISELTKGLAQDQERLDLQVLLAEALWNSHQEVAAGRVAAEVLKKLPYNIDANRLLASLWLKAGQPNEARPFIERVKELDPYQGYPLEHNGDNAPPDSFHLSTLEFTAEAHASQIGAADWVSEIKGIEKQKGVTGPLEKSGQITDIFSTPPAPAAPPSNMPSEMPTPDWLQDALGLKDAVVSPAAPAGTPASQSGPDWLKEALGDSAAPAPAAQAAEGTPDWLKDVLDETPASPPPSDAKAMPSPAGDVNAPDWLKDALGDTPAGPGVAATPSTPAPAADANAPDWLKDVLVEQTPPSVPSVGTPERQKPAWLNDILVDQPPAAPPAAPTVVTTDMLNKILTEGTPILADESESPAAGTAPQAGEQDFKFEDLPDLETWDGPLPEPVPPPPADWLTKDTGLDAPKAGKDEPEGEKPLPEWLAAETSAPPRADKSEPSQPKSGEHDLPDWLTVDTPVPAPKAAEPKVEESKDELPDWLKGEANPEPTPAAALEEEAKVAPLDQPTGDSASDEEVPDWLSSGDLDSDEAMKWLEEIAAKVDPNFKAEGEEASTPEAAAPAPAAASEPASEAAPPAAVEAAQAQEKEEPEGEKLPDWLKAEAPAGPAKPEPAEDLEWLRAPTEDKQEDKAEAKEELPEWLKTEPEQPAMKSEGASTDDALAWLDQQIAGQGVSPDKPVAESLTPDHPPLAARAPVPDLDAEAKPADDDELPDWLREAGAQGEISKALDSPTADADMASLPELPVEADELAWLNDALKAEEKSAGPDDLEELFAEAKPAQADKSAPAPADKQPQAEEAEELPDWLTQEEAPKPGPAAAAPEVAAPKLEQKGDELPDWLGAPTAEAEAPGESGLTDFLKAVEPAAPSAQDAPPKPEPAAVSPVPRPAPVAPPSPAPAPPPAAAPPAAPPAKATIPAGEADSQLKAARDQMANGELQAALPIYESLVKSGHKYDDVLSDLTELTKSRAIVNPRVYRLMGDALMGQGKTPEALEMFRKALDSF